MLEYAGHTNSEIAAAWIAYMLRCAERKEMGLEDLPPWSPIELADNEWPSMALIEFEYGDPVRALEISFLIARASDDEWVLGGLGAGAMETLLSHDGTLLDAIGLEARANPRLVTALQSTWQGGMSDEVWEAVQQLASS